MYVRNEECFYYLTVYNEAYDMPAMPGEQVREGIIRGLYPCEHREARWRETGSAVAWQRRAVERSDSRTKRSWRKSTVLPARFTARRVTRCSARTRSSANGTTACTRTRPRKCLTFNKCSARRRGPVIATSDYMRTVAEQVSPYLGGRLHALGTDGFGRSETRKALRRSSRLTPNTSRMRHWSALTERHEFDRAALKKAIADLGINPDAPHPWTV